MKNVLVYYVLWLNLFAGCVYAGWNLKTDFLKQMPPTFKNTGDTFIASEFNEIVEVVSGIVRSVFVADNGNVGIGTDIPNAKLEVKGSPDPTFRISSTRDAGHYYEWKTSGVNAENYDIKKDNNRLSLHGLDNHVFYIQGEEKFLIDSNGNVGIGTAIPSAKLEISGEVKADSFFTSKQLVQVLDETWMPVLLLTTKGVCDDTYGGLYKIQCGLSGATCLIGASGCNSGQDSSIGVSEQLQCARSTHAIYQEALLEIQVRGDWNANKYLWIKTHYRNYYENDQSRLCTITRII